MTNKNNLFLTNSLLQKTLGDPLHSNILARFTKDLLNLDVKKFTFENPKYSNYQGVRALAQLKDGMEVIIRVQILQKEELLSESDIEYYCLNELNKNFEERGLEDVSTLRPTFQINILDYQLFKNDSENLHTFEIDYKDYHQKYAPLTTAFFEIVNK